MRRVLVGPLLLLGLLVGPGPAPAGAATVRSELGRLERTGAVDAATAEGWRATLDGTEALARRVQGARKVALRGVLRAAGDVAAAGALDASTARGLFLTLARNREWWGSRPLLAGGARVRFPGSQLVWQHYPGEGLHVQWLGTFGRANALFAAKKDDELAALLDEALGLAADRAGGQAFEYLLRFDRGRPPWVSALAQGTAVQALSRAAVRLGEPRYFEAARSLLGIFRTAPPQGVRAATDAGAHFLLYSFRRDLRVLNGFVQALNGLWDFSRLANDDEGRALFAAGEAQLRAELPRYDTGAWSRYSNLRDSDLGYHRLVRDFLRGLCARLRDGAADGVADVPSADPYCATAERFTADLTTAPRLELLTRTLRERRAGALRFTLDKPATVTVTVRRAGKVVLLRSLRLDSGRRALEVRPAKRAPLAVTLAATDLAGNRAATSGTVRVLAAPRD